MLLTSLLRVISISFISWDVPFTNGVYNNSIISSDDNNNEDDSQSDTERLESQSVDLSETLIQICVQSRHVAYSLWLEQSYCEIGGIVHDLYKRLNKYYQSTEYSQLEDTKVLNGLLVIIV